MEGSLLLLLLLLLLLAVWTSGSRAEVIPRGLGETLAAQCEYPNQFKNHVKIWCKQTSEERCNSDFTTAWRPVGRPLGRTRIEDNKETRVISVTVEKLTEGDTGTYWCGVDVLNSIRIMKRIELKVSDGLPAHVILRGPGEIVTVRYDYPSYYLEYGKTWCRETSTGLCEPIVTTTLGVSLPQTPTWARTSIQDNKQTRVISVTVVNLTEKDTGVYWFGMDLRQTISYNNKIQLQVSEGVRKQVIPRGLGENVTLQCKYPDQYTSLWKTWCRETIRNTCNHVVNTQSTVTASSGRTTILDDKQTKVISVSIQQLTAEDTGIYWCGAYSIQVGIMKRFELQVFNDAKSTSNNTPTTERNQTPSLKDEISSGQNMDDGLETDGLDPNHIMYIGVGLGFLLLITLIALFYVVWIRRRRMQRMKDNCDTNGKTLSADPDVPPKRTRSEDESSFSEIGSHEVKYATLTHHGGNHGDATYSNVGLARRLAAPDAMANSENVEYASINL